MRWTTNRASALLFAALATPAMASDLLQLDPWAQLTTADLWNKSRNDIAISSVLRQMETDHTRKPLQLGKLLEQFLVAKSDMPKWSMGSSFEQVRWFGPPEAAGGKSYRMAVGIIGSDKVTPTRLVDKEYSKSWVLTMSGDGSPKFAPTRLKIATVAIFDRGQAINKMPTADLPKALRASGLQAKQMCIESGTQYEVGHFLVEKGGRSLHLLFAYTFGTGQESLDYTVRWGDVSVDCKNLAEFGM